MSSEFPVYRGTPHAEKDPQLYGLVSSSDSLTKTALIGIDSAGEPEADVHSMMPKLLIEAVSEEFWIE